MSHIFTQSMNLCNLYLFCSFNLQMCPNSVLFLVPPPSIKDFLSSFCHSFKETTPCFHVTYIFNCLQCCSQVKCYHPPSLGQCGSISMLLHFHFISSIHFLLPAILFVYSFGVLIIHLILRDFVFLFHLLTVPDSIHSVTELDLSA